MLSSVQVIYTLTKKHKDNHRFDITTTAGTGLGTWYANRRTIVGFNITTSRWEKDESGYLHVFTDIIRTLESPTNRRELYVNMDVLYNPGPLLSEVIADLEVTVSNSKKSFTPANDRLVQRTNTDWSYWAVWNDIRGATDFKIRNKVLAGDTYGDTLPVLQFNILFILLQLDTQKQNTKVKNPKIWLDTDLDKVKARPVGRFSGLGRMYEYVNGMDDKSERGSTWSRLSDSGSDCYPPLRRK